MTAAEAYELLRPGVAATGGRWADLGAGAGLFTRALARLLGPAGTVYALDREERAVATLRMLTRERPADSATIIAVQGDFQQLDDMPELAGLELDGVLFANALHFVRQLEPVLVATGQRLMPEGRIVVVEYEGRRPNRWVPFPVSLARLDEAARTASLEPPVVVSERPSRYGGTMYCAVLAQSPSRAAGAPQTFA